MEFQDPVEEQWILHLCQTHIDFWLLHWFLPRKQKPSRILVGDVMYRLCGTHDSIAFSETSQRLGEQDNSRRGRKCLLHPRFPVWPCTPQSCGRTCNGQACHTCVVRWDYRTIQTLNINQLILLRIWDLTLIIDTCIASTQSRNDHVLQTKHPVLEESYILSYC